MGISLGTRIKIIRLVLTVIGIGFAVWSYQFIRFCQFTSNTNCYRCDTDKVMAYYIFDAASFILGMYHFRKI